MRQKKAELPALLATYCNVDMSFCGQSRANFSAVLESQRVAESTMKLIDRPPPADGELLRVRNLALHFYIVKRHGFASKRKIVKAVDNVSFNLGRREIMGLVGESGCGKTTTARLIAGLLKPHSGSIFLDGVDLAKLSEGEKRKVRRSVQVIFQDPVSSLNPRMRVGSIIGEPLWIHGERSAKARLNRIRSLLREVGLPEDVIHRYPYELSGGQRQRVGIARALALEPALVIADEPVSALDVSIQAQVLNLIQGIHEKRELAIILISHDLSVVRAVCQKLAIMYMGRIVEMGPTELVLSSPMHPYTQALLSAVPIPDPDARVQEPPLRGEGGLAEGVVPSEENACVGCGFSPRCPFRMDVCSEVSPELAPVPEEPQHLVSCFLYDDGVGSKKDG